MVKTWHVAKPWHLLALTLLTASVCSCTVVEPWERGKLAKPQMAPTPNSLQSKLRTHVQSSREAATGGDVAAGGGCGCY